MKKRYVESANASSLPDAELKKLAMNLQEFQMKLMQRIRTEV